MGEESGGWWELGFRVGFTYRQPVPVMITYTDSIGGKRKPLHEHLKLL